VLLALDVGNTTVGIAIFDGDTIVTRNRLMTPDEISVTFLKSLIKEKYRHQITDIIASSVVPFVDASLRESAVKLFQLEPVFVDHTTDTGVALKIVNPPEIGADRIADSVGGLLFFEPPLIIIDSGTAITFDIINTKYEYVGGTIFPGIELSINSLAKNTAKLNRVRFKKPDSIIGTTTEESIQAGIYYNYVGGITYMIGEYKKVLGEGAKVIATGGLSKYFKDQIKTIDRFEPDLIFYGLKKINDKQLQV